MQIKPYNTAIFYDMENLYSGYTNFVAHDLDFQNMTRRIKDLPYVGNVAIQFAYADWRLQKLQYFNSQLDNIGIERRHVYVKAEAQTIQNAVDMQMTIDALEVLFTNPHIEIFVLATGDSGFLSLVHRLHQHGKYVIGLARPANVNPYFMSICDSFILIEDAPAPNAKANVTIAPTVQYVEKPKQKKLKKPVRQEKQKKAAEDKREEVVPQVAPEPLPPEPEPVPEEKPAEPEKPKFKFSLPDLSEFGLTAASTEREVLATLAYAIHIMTEEEPYRSQLQERGIEFRYFIDELTAKIPEFTPNRFKTTNMKKFLAGLFTGSQLCLATKGKNKNYMMICFRDRLPKGCVRLDDIHYPLFEGLHAYALLPSAYNEIVAQLQQEANEEAAKRQAVLIKNQAAFLGVNAERRSKLTHELIKQSQELPLNGLLYIAITLYRLKKREFQYFAIDLLAENQKRLREEDLQQIRSFINQEPWADTADKWAKVLSACLKGNKEQLSAFARQLNEGSVWEKRAALLLQIGYKKETDADLLRELVSANRDSDDPTISKAIEKAVKDYQKTDKTFTV